MFVGHEFAAFALAAAIAHRLGRDDATAVTIGLVAAASAFVPDLDLLAIAPQYVGAILGRAALSWEGFWGVSHGVHRGLSHTLLGGAMVAGLLGSSASVARRSGRGRLRAVAAGAVPACALVALAVATGGVGAVLAAVLVGLGAVVVGRATAARTNLAPRTILGAAVLGILVHPFGDVFLATPPAFAFPLPRTLEAPIRLAIDPTWNLLAVALVEIGTVWAGLKVYASLRDVSLSAAIDRRALAGLAYPLLVAPLPTPTMADAHWLGFSLVPLAGVGLTARVHAGESGATSPRERRVLVALATGLATITIASLAYGVRIAMIGP